MAAQLHYFAAVWQRGQVGEKSVKLSDVSQGEQKSYNDKMPVVAKFLFIFEKRKKLWQLR